MNDVSRSGNPQSTNVGVLFKQVEKLESSDDKFSANYYAGPGTTNALPNSSVAPTEQVTFTAQKAFQDFTRDASTWLESHPDQPVTAMVTSFSRGGSSAAIFSQLLYEKGLIDPSTGKILIPPGEIGVSAGLIYDPVYTGIGGLNTFTDPNLAFAPNAKNITVVCAENEYRSAFLAVDYSDSPNVTTVDFMGNHCDSGGGYDNGLGAIALDAGVRFFQNSGLNIEADPARAFDATKPVAIHSEEIDTYGNGKWTVYGSVEQGTKRMFKDFTTPAATTTSDDGTVTTSFTAQNGHQITDVVSKNSDGSVKEEVFTVRELGGLYKEYRFDAQKHLVATALNWRDDANRDVRHEKDIIAETYHDYVHENAESDAKVVWEAWDWKDEQGRDVRREYDHATGGYHDYVHATKVQDSAVIWEAYNWKDGASRDVRHEVDKTSGLYHDYIHATADTNSTVIWEAWNAKDETGRDVRHERDLSTNTFHDYVHTGGDQNSPVVEESWNTANGDSFNQFKIAYASGSAHFEYTKANGDTGWADSTGEEIAAWDSTTQMPVVGVIGYQPNPAYTGGYLSRQSPYIAQYGTIGGEMHQWYHSAKDFGWHYASSHGLKYKTMTDGSLSTDAALANPISGANPAVLQTNAFDNWGLPTYNSFEFDDYFEGHLAEVRHSETAFA